MKNIKLLLIIFALAMFSCDEYLDVNTDPNRLEISQVGPDKLLPAAQLRAFRNQSTTMNQLGNVFMNSWYANVQQYTGGYSFETRLDVDNVFYTGIFEQTYLAVANLQLIIDYPNANHKYDYYIAAAKILKANYLQRVVDLYGNVPYSEAFKGVANTTPKYDDDQLVYKKLLMELSDARALITAANPAADDISSTDIMIRGNMNVWNQFANTIELRMLMRMSNCTGTLGAFRDAKLSAIASASFLNQAITINPGFLKTDAQLNPFYSYAVADAADATVQNFSFIAPTAHFYKSLNAYTVYPTGSSTEIKVKELQPAGFGVNYPNVADPRRGRLFRTGAGQPYLRAITSGSNTIDMFAPGQIAGVTGRVGLGVFNPNNAVPTITSTGNLLADGFKVDGYVMTLSEVKFLLAEASIFRPALFPNGSTDFDAGINASMTYLNAVPGTYVATINTKPNFGWTGTNSEKLHAVMYQKWISTMSVNAIESYIDYIKTGFPLTPLSVNAIQVRKPRRLIYPQSEYLANSINTPVVTPAQAFAATDSSHPFWLLGDPAPTN